MSKILIVYGTTQGQTEKIACRIKDELLSLGHNVSLFDNDKVFNSIDSRDFDAVIIGASVHLENYQRRLKKWVSVHAQILNHQPSAFFSVSLGVLQNETSVEEEVSKTVNEFLKSTSWKPRRYVIFAGALLYSKYNLISRWVMKCISKNAGGDTDTTKDYEYTNWDAVCRFAREFSSDIQSESVINSKGSIKLTENI